MANKTKKLHFHVVRGTLELAAGKRAAGEGFTSDPEVIEQLTALSEVKDSLGQSAYVRVWYAQADSGEEQGIVDGDSPDKPSTLPPAGTDAPPTGGGEGEGDGDTPAPLTFKLAENVSEEQARTVVEILARQGHTLESANLLSDKALIDLDDIGKGRAAHIRALGTANAYPAFQPPAE